MARRWYDGVPTDPIRTSASGEGRQRAEGTISADDDLLDRLSAAIGRLEAAALSDQGRRAAGGDLRETVQQLEADRSELARRLDAAETRVEQLLAVNRDVSTRLVASMEKVRTILDGMARD